jgi:signal transduction histidine kinase
MTQSGYALIGLTVIVAALAGVLTFALLRFAAAARDTRRHLRDGGAESALLAVALQDAVGKLKAQERAMSARATASEQLSDQIVASLTAGLLVVDGDGRVEILNPAATRLLGLGQVDGRDYRELLAQAPALVAVIAECLDARRPILRRTIRIPPGMPATHLGVTVSPISGGAGAICLFADLSAVVELEEQLRLKETLAQLGELTAGIAHEFRNGLATIHGYSRLMDPQQMPQQYRPYVEGIRQETEALGKVITNFLNFAKPDRVAFAAVSLESLVARTVDEARHDLPQADLVVDGAFGTVEGDEVLLRQMLLNLIRNGVEAAQGAGGRPAVRIAGGVDETEGVCTLAVHDNGPGVDPAVRDRVFRPFFTTRSQGTGLGLAIVQKVVVTHNGRIAVGTSPLGGAAFDVTFPLRVPQSA